jgi:hypothetical protein
VGPEVVSRQMVSVGQVSFFVGSNLFPPQVYTDVFSYPHVGSREFPQTSPVLVQAHGLKVQTSGPGWAVHDRVQFSLTVGTTPTLAQSSNALLS